MNPIKRLFSGSYIFQILVGLPASILLFVWWPDIAHHMDKGAVTFGYDILQPGIVAFIYLMAANLWAYTGAALMDEHFPPKSLFGCDNLAMLYFLLMVLFSALSIALIA